MATRVRWRHRIEFAAVKVALFVLNVLPERPAYWLVGSAGRLYFRCSKARQHYALRLLRNAFPDKTDEERLAIASAATANIFKVALDTVWAIPWMRRGKLLERVDPGGLGHFPAPCIGVTAHLGSWEMGAAAVAMTSGEVHAIARAFKNPLLNEFIVENRRAVGLHVHPKRGGIRNLTRALARGKIGLQVTDQYQRLRGVRAPFFGEVTNTDRSAAVLALRKGYPIGVGYCVRIGSGFRFRGELLEPFVPESTGDFEADVARTVAEVNRRLEQIILAHPDQYLWIHNRYHDKLEKKSHDSAA